MSIRLERRIDYIRAIDRIQFLAGYKDLNEKQTEEWCALSEACLDYQRREFPKLFTKE